MNILKLIKKIFHKHFIRVHGKNNVVEACLDKKIFIKIYGDNNKVIIKDTVHPLVCNVYIGCYDCRVDNCIVEIGENVSSNGLDIRVMEDSSTVRIGDDTMISFNVDIWASDTHSILDADNNLINMGKSVQIGNHVWISKDVTICKNTEIADNCIVGACSVITKKFSEKNCIIAGNPAVKVKENVNWSRKRPKQYCKPE